MTGLADTASFVRRHGDFPVLLVSQDYELFFGRSGSIEKCLFEPGDMLADFAARRDLRITFFVDAGMLSRMRELASTHPSVERQLSSIQKHVEGLACAGHEIGLHIHPHWEEARWNDGTWDFSGTRYQLRDFSDEEVADIVCRYTRLLNDLCNGSVRTYRAGGFCTEPFETPGEALLKAGISVDSSVVPGAVLEDASKGFDYGAVADEPWWNFERSPAEPNPDGCFLEVPVTPQRLPFFHYWGRAVDRLMGRQAPSVIGDGSSKALGRREITRRLMGYGRVSELSTDAPKARQLGSARVLRQDRKVWHVMGHPKLLGAPSLDALDNFMQRMAINRSQTVFELACAIRASDPVPG